MTPENRVGVVTGAARGIGRRVALTRELPEKVESGLELEIFTARR